MAKSSLVGVDLAPAIPKGRDIDAQGPSDSSDSGSDVQGELDLGADEVGLPRDMALAIEHSGDTDAAGTGERGAALLDEAVREGADIGVDRITGAPDSDAEWTIDEPELEGLDELATGGPEDEDDEDEDEDEDGDDDIAPRAPPRKLRTPRQR